MLIKLEQKPVIDFSSVEQVGKEIENELSKYNLDNLLVTEDTVKGLKSLRARFNKDFANYEASRKAIKSAVNDPYKQFEDAYKQHIASKYKDADSKLKTAIDEVEDKQREEKTNKLKLFYEDVCNEYGINFIAFEQLGLNITLSAPIKPLEILIEDKIKQAHSDCELIMQQEHHARILTRYKSTLNASQSIIDVLAEIKQEEEFAEMAKKPTEDAIEVVSEEVANKLMDAISKNEEQFKMTFTVSGTKEQLKAVKNFMTERGIKYE